MSWMKLSAPYIWKKGHYLWKKETLSCICFSNVRGTRGTAAPIVLRRNVTVSKMKTDKMSHLKGGCMLVVLLQPFPHFLENAHTMVLSFGNEMESSLDESNLQISPWYEKERFKLCLFSTISYEIKEIKKQ